MSDSFLSECSIFSRINDLSKSVRSVFLLSRGLENTKVSRHFEDVLSVLFFFMCSYKPILLGEKALAEVTVPLNIL